RAGGTEESQGLVTNRLLVTRVLPGNALTRGSSLAEPQTNKHLLREPYPMKNFEYASPTTEAEVLEHLRDFPGETELIAGGTDLVGLMQKMVITPKRVVNLLDVPSFRDVEQLDGGVISIGATVTLDTLLVHPYLNPYAALRDAIDGIASLQIQCQ